MRDGDRLNRGPYLHIFFDGRAALQIPIKAGATHLGQLTHPLDTEAALQRHHFLVRGVNYFCDRQKYPLSPRTARRSHRRTDLVGELRPPASRAVYEGAGGNARAVPAERTSRAA
jgi:hypothetical protein